MTRRLFAFALLSGSLYLSWCIVLAVQSGNLFEAAGRLAREPWGWVTIVDLYLGFLVVGGLMVWRERRPVRWLPWLAALFLLGNLASAAYLVRWLLTGQPVDPRT